MKKKLEEIHGGAGDNKTSAVAVEECA